MIDGKEVYTWAQENRDLEKRLLDAKLQVVTLMQNARKYIETYPWGANAPELGILQKGLDELAAGELTLAAQQVDLVNAIVNACAAKATEFVDPMHHKSVRRSIRDAGRRAAKKMHEDSEAPLLANHYTAGPIVGRGR